MVGLDGAPFEAGTHEAPLTVNPGVEVQAAGAAVGHVRHVVGGVGPLGVEGGRVAAETDIKAGRVGAQVPQRVPDYAVKAFGEAAVTGAFLLVRFPVNWENGSVGVLVSFLCPGCEQTGHQGSEKQDFLHEFSYNRYKNTKFCRFAAND